MIVASVDIGTNTIILLIADVDLISKELKTIENYYRIPRIGKGLKEGTPLPKENLKRMLNILDEYYEIIEKHNCEKIILTGTNALRIVSNKNEIISLIKKKYDYDLNVISGEEEAKYSYLGSISSYNKKQKFLVIDIGGGSTEIIYGNGIEIIYSKSFNIGVVSGTENFLISDPPTGEQIQNFINHSQATFLELKFNAIDIYTAIAIAGTPTTLASIKQRLTSYNEDIIEGSILNDNELDGFIRVLTKMTSSEILNKYSSIVEGREDILLAGTILLNEIMKLLNTSEVQVSTKGIRYGAIKVRVYE